MDKDYLTFWEHLEELRWVLLRTIIALAIFTGISFAFMPSIFETVIMAPCSSDFILYRGLCQLSEYTSILPEFCNDGFHVDIININLASQFFTHMSTSFWMAVILTCPYLLFEVWRFISPALFENEKKGTRWAFVFGTFMFFVGCTIGYLLVFPLTLRFLIDYKLSSNILNQISLDSYMDNFMSLIFIMGLVFELPLVAWLLSKMGLVTKNFFRKFRRHAIVILMILAAVITPSGDPFTLMVVFLPLYILYEISCFFVKEGVSQVEDINIVNTQD